MDIIYINTMKKSQEKTLNWIRNILIIIVLGIGFWMYAEVPHNFFSKERGSSFIENSTKQEERLLKEFWGQWDLVNQSYIEYMVALDDYNREIDLYNNLSEEYNKRYRGKSFPRHYAKKMEEEEEKIRAQWDICLQKRGRVEQLEEIYFREEERLQNISDQIDKL